MSDQHYVQIAENIDKGLKLIFAQSNARFLL